MVTTKVLLLACGSFNPPTLMHLRMFEVAKDTLRKQGLQVVGGVISPVHDGYGKQDLAKSEERLEMVRLCTSDSEWIRVSDWECQQSEWQCTIKVLQHHQNFLNSIPNDTINANQLTPLKNGPKKQKISDTETVPGWLTTTAVTAAMESEVKVMLLCGADMFETFIKPGVWRQEHLEEIMGKFGLVVLHREGCDPHDLIYESDLLNKYQSNIIVAKEWIANNVSSTKVRRAIRRGDSVKYLVHDKTINLIQNIYAGNNTYEYQSIFPTPSPNDVPMPSDSPTTNFMNEINSLKVPQGRRPPPTLLIDKCSFPGQAVKVQGERLEKAAGDEPETKVEIQITKDGIKVISDKETTV